MANITALPPEILFQIFQYITSNSPWYDADTNKDLISLLRPSTYIHDVAFAASTTTKHAETDQWCWRSNVKYAADIIQNEGRVRKAKIPLVELEVTREPKCEATRREEVEVGEPTRRRKGDLVDPSKQEQEGHGNSLRILDKAEHASRPQRCLITWGTQQIWLELFDESRIAGMIRGRRERGRFPWGV